MLSQNQKDDLITSVYIEMKRMFGILSNRKSEEQISFLKEMEAVMKGVILAQGKLPKLPEAI